MPDPRSVPVLGTDAHLPAVPGAHCQPEALRRCLRLPPPWQPEAEQPVGRPRGTRAPVPAAVLIPVLTRPQPTVLLTERSAGTPTHAGQVAFPGGKIEAGDADAVAAALREAEEEIALPRQAVEVLGCLPTHTTLSAYAITPVLALVSPQVRLQPDAREVASIFEVPLEFLMNPAHHRHHELMWQGQLRHWLSMPYHDGRCERYIWGATAAMLRNLYRLLSAASG